MRRLKPCSRARCSLLSLPTCSMRRAEFSAGCCRLPDLSACSRPSLRPPGPAHRPRACPRPGWTRSSPPGPGCWKRRASIGPISGMASRRARLKCRPRSISISLPRVCRPKLNPGFGMCPGLHHSSVSGDAEFLEARLRSAGRSAARSAWRRPLSRDSPVLADPLVDALPIGRGPGPADFLAGRFLAVCSTVPAKPPSGLNDAQPPSKAAAIKTAARRPGGWAAGCARAGVLVSDMLDFMGVLCAVWSGGMSNT